MRRGQELARVEPELLLEQRRRRRRDRPRAARSPRASGRRADPRAARGAPRRRPSHPSAPATHAISAGWSSSSSATACGRTIACSSACGRSYAPPSTWQIRWCSPVPATASADAARNAPLQRDRRVAGIRGRRRAPGSRPRRRATSAGSRPGRRAPRRRGPSRSWRSRRRAPAGRLARSSGSYTTSRGTTAGDDARHLAPPVGDPVDRRHLRAGVRRRHGRDRQPGLQRDRLRGAGHRAAADAQQPVRAGVGRGLARRRGDLGRDVRPRAGERAGQRDAVVSNGRSAMSRTRRAPRRSSSGARRDRLAPAPKTTRPPAGSYVNASTAARRTPPG